MKTTGSGRGAEMLSLFFAAGTALWAAALRDIAGSGIHYAICSAAVTAACACMLAAAAGRGGTGAMAAAAFACGLFCAASDALPGVGCGSAAPGALRRTASAAAGYLQGVLDTIPFPHSGTAPILHAVILGDRSLLDSGTVRLFRDAGASHLLALSGLHMGIIYLLFTRLTSFTGNFPAAKTLKYAATIALSGFYTIMTGASPSTVRAFLFIFLNESIKFLGRRRSPAKVLCAALTLQLAAAPSVIASAGFQLSYLAMSGIFFIHPSLSAMYRGGRFDPVKKIWDAATLALACQISTAPLAWFRFRSFPAYFLITNLTAVPLTACIVAVSAATLALSAAGLCPPALVRLDDALVTLLTHCLEIICEM